MGLNNRIVPTKKGIIQNKILNILKKTQQSRKKMPLCYKKNFKILDKAI
jgi:hypothetical protein